MDQPADAVEVLQAQKRLYQELGRLVAFIGLLAVVPACGGSGGGSNGDAPPPPTVLFFDDFSEENVSNWTGGCMYDALSGNPAPSMEIGQFFGTESTTSNLQFSFVAGLTVSFDCNCAGANFPDQFFAGIDDPQGATGEGSGFTLSNGAASIYFNNTTPLANISLTAGWHNYKIVILPNTAFVEFYIDGFFYYASTAAMNVPSPQSILFASNASNMNVDNVLVTSP